ncbi:helix-turn-helix domain-containing protein [Rhodospirillum centenum]|uniref:helix-turn-helix domain-containing protein n=1 Tax=Rhodospirillum centenum TaxID=34018 RepID=UPI0011D0A51D|nr:helix-turn-helix domain-containing protein [Rhodospirillum centenum]
MTPTNIDAVVSAASLTDDSPVVPLLNHLEPDALFLGVARDFCRRSPTMADRIMPPLVVALAKAGGYDAALTLVWKRGGQSPRLPSPYRIAGSWLAEIVGKATAIRMYHTLEARQTAEGRVHIPTRAAVRKCVRLACLEHLAAAGLSKARIASVLGMSERTVWRHISDRRKADLSRKQG